eukprot:scaffold128020_cov47-Attheya_sp.AAC.2
MKLRCMTFACDRNRDHDGTIIIGICCHDDDWIQICDETTKGTLSQLGFNARLCEGFIFYYSI